MTTELSLVGGTRICVQCEHIGTNSSKDWTLYKCFAPENKIDSSINLVTGDTVTRWKVVACVQARDGAHLCGPQGKWYQERTFKLTQSASELLKIPVPKPGKVTADDL